MKEIDDVVSFLIALGLFGGIYFALALLESWRDRRWREKERQRISELIEQKLREGRWNV